MLDRIEIDNFATIEHLSFDLGPGLNIITGETGSGKSVLVQAMNLALGDRADLSMVRSGAKKALIQLTGTGRGEDFIITRELTAAGKSVAKVNGEILPVNKLRAFCEPLVDVHGQYDNQTLLNPENHISLLDRYAMTETEPALAAVLEAYQHYHDAKRDYDALIREEKEARRRQDFMQFEYDYIVNLELTPGEDRELEEQLDLMRNSEHIFSAVSGAYDILQSDEGSLLSGLSACMTALQGVASYSDDLSSASEEMTDLYYRLEDLSGSLRSISESIQFSPEEIDAISSRLSSIEDAKRKYGMSVEEILAYAEELDRKLNLLINMDEEIASKEAAMNEARAKLEEEADELHEIRVRVAERLKDAITKELRELAFTHAEFDIQMTRSETVHENGYDIVEFMIATNPGEPLRPLARIASGGEISRIMLAFKCITGDRDQTETMIFDEIDTGISGHTALIVGRKMAALAKRHQIICITHLPQIAACGDDHYSIEKAIENGTSHTHIEHLTEEGKLRSLARLLTGDPDSDQALLAARDLLEQEKNHKQEI